MTKIAPFLTSELERFGRGRGRVGVDEQPRESFQMKAGIDFDDGRVDPQALRLKNGGILLVTLLQIEFLGHCTKQWPHTSRAGPMS